MDNWPSKQEKTPDDIYRGMAEVASPCSRATNEEFEAAGGNHSQFRNNFFHLFLGLRQASEELISVQINRRRLEKLGEKWTRFFKENQDLIHRINSALDEVSVYQELYRSLENLRDRADLFDRAGNELKIEHIGIAAWNKLNPLLEEAWNKMEEYGINPSIFQ